MAQDSPDGQDEKDTLTEQSTENDHAVERRSFIQLAGAASLAGAGLTASGSADAQSERHGISFDRVLHAVDDLGMDSSGNQSIDGALSSAAGSGTLIVFPPGKYRVNQQLTLKNVSNFGIIGESGNRSDVEFVTNSGNALDWLVAVGGRNHVYENFTFQQTRDEKTSFSNVWKIPTGLHIENVELAGWNPRDDTYDTKPGLKPQITDRDGVGVLKDFVCTGGGVVDTYPARRVPIWMGPSHRGELRVVDANIQESGSHSIYASRTNGCIRVEGGLFKNNDNTNLRISSGHPDKLSWIRGAEVVIDTDNAEHLPDGERYQQTRGIRVESGFQGWSGLLIEDCDLVMKSTPNSAGLIVVEDNHGAVTVRNTRLRNDVDGQPFINAKQPNYSNVDSPYRLVLDNVNITGSAANSNNAVRIRGRNGSVVKNSCVERQYGNGVKVVGSNDCAVENANINVPGDATVFRNSSVSTSGITHGDSCPLPSFDGTGSDTSGDPVDGTIYGSGTDLDHLLDVTSDGAQDVVDYEFTVDGDLEGVDLNSEDSVDGLTGSGAVAGGTDTFGFSGSITDLSASSGLTVMVDGQQVDTSQWNVGGDDTNDSTGDSTTGPSTSLDVSGGSPGNVVDYEFTVDGDLAGDALNSEDSVDGLTGSGAVAGGTDSYLFSGSITDLSASGDLTVTVDGQQVDISQWRPDRVVTIDGGGERADYEFAVSGSLEKSTDDGASINGDDAVDGSTATGAVWGGSDSYRFGGEFTAFALDGDATVYVDGQQVDPVTLGPLPNAFVVDGTGKAGTTEYAFQVTGDLRADESVGGVEDGDTIESGSATGSVSDEVDAFRFSGDMTYLRLDGSASINFEDNDG